MDTAGYVALTRQKGLLDEMQAVANNIANISTTGFRREGVVFAEFIRAAGRDAPSISFADAHGRRTDFGQAGLAPTGSAFDLAIEGTGFFQVEAPDGIRLTRAGAFTPNAEGELATPDGFLLLDTGGAAIFVPPDAAGIAVAADGTLSVDGRPLAQVAVVAPGDATALVRLDGVSFKADGTLLPAEDARIVQGFLEASNVDPVLEIARMIEVQRSYEMSQRFLDREDERVRGVVRTLGQ
jgi:flagellar basal-body rod protein FlgF